MGYHTTMKKNKATITHNSMDVITLKEEYVICDFIYMKFKHESNYFLVKEVRIVLKVSD